MNRKSFAVLIIMMLIITSPVFAHGKKGGSENDRGNQSSVWMIARETAQDRPIEDYGRFYTPAECEAKLKTLSSAELYICARFPD